MCVIYLYIYISLFIHTYIHTHIFCEVIPMSLYCPPLSWSLSPGFKVDQQAKSWSNAHFCARAWICCQPALFLEVQVSPFVIIWYWKKYIINLFSQKIISSGLDSVLNSGQFKIISGSQVRRTYIKNWIKRIEYSSYIKNYNLL